MSSNSTRPLLIRYALDASGRQLALIRINDLNETSTYDKAYESGDISILIEANLMAVTYSIGLLPPQRALSTVLPRRLRSAFSLLATFRSGLLSASQDILTAAKEESNFEQEEEASTTSSSFFNGTSNFSPCSLEEVFSSALLPFPSSSSSSSFSFSSTLNSNVNPQRTSESVVSGEQLNWSVDAVNIVSTWARAASLGADPLIPGLSGRTLDKSFITLYPTHINIKSTSTTIVSSLSLGKEGLERVEKGDDFSSFASRCSRPSTFPAIAYWTPQSLTLLAGRDTDCVASFGIASNIRVERLARPPSIEKGLFVDAYRFRCDSQGFFSFQCEKSNSSLSSQTRQINADNKKDNISTSHEKVTDQDSKGIDSKIGNSESIALRLLVLSGHIESSDIARQAVSKSSTLDAGLVADGRVFGIHFKDVQSVSAGGSLFQAANISAYMATCGNTTRECAIQTLERRKWQLDCDKSVNNNVSVTNRTVLFHSTALDTFSEEASADISMASSNKGSSEGNSSKSPLRIDERDRLQIKTDFFFNNATFTPSRDFAPSPIAGSVDVTCLDQEEIEGDESSKSKMEKNLERTTESVYYLHADSTFSSSSSSSSSSSLLKLYPGVSLATLKAAGVIEDDMEEQIRLRNEQREKLVALSLIRSRALLEITRASSYLV